MKKEVKYCECCGAKMMEYRHHLNKQMADALLKLLPFEHADLKQIRLERNQWQNFQKIQYWGLVEKYFEGGERQGGCWSVTDKGKRFLKGEISVPCNVWTYRNRTIKEDDKKVNIEDLIPDFKWRLPKDYAEDAIPHGNKQRDLF